MKCNDLLLQFFQLLNWLSNMRISSISQNILAEKLLNSEAQFTYKVADIQQVTTAWTAREYRTVTPYCPGSAFFQ